MQPQEPEYPWVEAIHRARHRLPRLKVGVAAAGTFLLGLIAATAAGQSAVASPQAPAPAPMPSMDIFGQTTQAGPDNQPGAADPGLYGGDNQAQPVPPIVSAPS